MLRTRLTEQLGIEHPIICAGMAFVGSPRLVAAISNAGGLGAIGTALIPPPGVTALLRAARH